MQIQKKDEECRQRLADEKQVLRLKGYSETDFQSAMTKLTEAALRYDRGGALAAGLGGFNNVTMPPHVFKVTNLSVSVIEKWSDHIVEDCWCC